MNKKTTQNGILCIGRTYCDLLFSGLDHMPVLGREVFADGLAIEAGGGAFITAAHLHYLGQHSALLSRIGTDALSNSLLGLLKQSNIDLQFLEKSADAGPQVTVVTIQENDRAFLSRRAGSAKPKTLPLALKWPNAGHLHIAEYATLHEIPGLIADAQQAGLTISLDPSWDETLIHGTGILAHGAGIDVFMPNMEEASAITGHTNPQDAITTLAQHFPVIALKVGADGAYMAYQGEIFHQPAPKVPVIDTTGAGDAFNAGFLAAWLNHASPNDCLKAGIDAGSRAVQMAGGAGKLFSKHPSVA